jgi:hypothetical protein
MAMSTARASSRKQANRWNAIARRKRMLSLKRKLLPDRVLKLLAAAALPAQKRAYQQKLRELLGE